MERGEAGALDHEPVGARGRPAQNERAVRLGAGLERRQAASLQTVDVSAQGRVGDGRAGLVAHASTDLRAGLEHHVAEVEDFLSRADVDGQAPRGHATPRDRQGVRSGGNALEDETAVGAGVGAEQRGERAGRRLRRPLPAG